MSERIAKRVMLIGWDAADWQIIDDLIERGGMPNLARFKREGAWGNISTLEPILSPILWNSIATGKRADKHDILGFMEPDGEGFLRPVSSSSRKAKAVWNILSQRDMRSVVVGWFASYPAEKIKGAIVTDRYEALVDNPDMFAGDANSYHPESLKDDLREMHVDRNAIGVEQIKAFIPDVESVDTSVDPRPGIFAHMMSQCVSVHNAATLLVEDEDWDFAALYYTAIDHFGHAFQEYHPPRMDHVTEEDFARYSQVITSVYQYHDLMLGRLLELAGEDTTVIVMSDHGFKSGIDRPKFYVDPNDPSKKVGPGMNPVAWHRQMGVLAALGPGIAKGREVKGASLLDLCPTVLTLLGVPVGEDMDGHVIEPLFEQKPVVETVASHEPEHADDGVHRGEHVEDPYAAQEVLKQLEELGYVDGPGEDKEKRVERTLRDRKDSLATVYFASGRIAEAATLMSELHEEMPEEAYYRYRLCNALAALGRFDDVERLVDEAKGKPEEAPMLAMIRGQVLLSRGESDEALELFESVRKQAPGMPRLRCLMARPLIRARRWDEAEAVLREALEINEDDPEALDLLGLTLRGAGRLEEAAEAHMRSVTLLHDQPVAHVNLGVTMMKAQQWDWAIRAFEVALELRPNNPVAHRNLARIYKDVKNDRDKATEHLRAAWVARSGSSDRILKHQLDYGQW